MKTWIKVLIIGIVLFFVGAGMVGNALRAQQYELGGIGWWIFILGIILIIGAIVAAAKRLFGKMLND